jgi:hypothetical protein
MGIHGKSYPPSANRSQLESFTNDFAEDKIKEMVGTGRFELPTPRTPSECSTRLSHVPTQSSRLG